MGNGNGSGNCNYLCWMPYSLFSESSDWLLLELEFLLENPALGWNGIVSGDSLFPLCVQPFLAAGL